MGTVYGVAIAVILLFPWSLVAIMLAGALAQRAAATYRRGRPRVRKVLCAARRAGLVRPRLLAG